MKERSCQSEQEGKLDLKGYPKPLRSVRVVKPNRQKALTVGLVRALRAGGY